MNTRYVALAALLLGCGAAHAQWLPNHSIQRLGLYDGPHTGGNGVQSSSIIFLSPNDVIAGYSTRYRGTNTTNGQDVWGWNGTSTVQLGFTGPGYVGSAAYQNSILVSQNTVGVVIGRSDQITGVSTKSGSDAWLWNGSSAIQLGLLGGDHVSSTGARESAPNVLNNMGNVIGSSGRYLGSVFNGNDAWFWNGAAIQLGFVGGTYTGSSGYRSSAVTLLNDVGQVAGTSTRITGVSTPNGVDAWVWNGSTTVRIGLSGGANTSSTGIEASTPKLQNESGQVAGTANRYTGANTVNGQDAWAWGGSATTQIGLTGGVFTGSAGYQNSSLVFQSAVGQIVGYSSRLTGVNTDNGQSAWAWRGSSTTQIGLTRTGYTSAGGRQETDVLFQNASGQVVGESSRLSGVDERYGTDAWVWNGLTTVQIGLTGGVYTALDGTEVAIPRAQNSAGRVLGYSTRYRNGLAVQNGQDTWVWSGSVTSPVGLIGSAYTDAGTGYRFNDASLLSSAGVVAGYAKRLVGGQDTWYYDPATNSTLLVISSVRASDGFADSSPVLLTDDGFLFGTYKYFGDGSGQIRAFAFRPDFGVVDLNGLVAGGLSLAGWNNLFSAEFCNSVRTIAGRGVFTGQALGSSVYVMIPSPAPGAMFGMAVMMMARRRGR